MLSMNMLCVCVLDRYVIVGQYMLSIDILSLVWLFLCSYRSLLVVLQSITTGIRIDLKLITAIPFSNFTLIPK